MTLKGFHIYLFFKVRGRTPRSKSGTTVLIGLGTLKLPRTGRYVLGFSRFLQFSPQDVHLRLFPLSAKIGRRRRPLPDFQQGFFHVKTFQGHTKLGETESIANTQTPGVSLLHSQSAEIQRMA